MLSQLLRWLIITLLFPLVCLNGWLVFQILQYFQPLVTIAILATLLAFILNFPVQFLQERGLKRGQAVLLVVLAAFSIVVALGVTLIPLLLEDVGEVAELLPQWIDSGTEQLQAFQIWAVSHRLPINVSRIQTQLTNDLQQQIQPLSDGALGIALGAIDSLSQILLVTVLTFYFLLDAERLSVIVFRRLPLKIRSQVKQSLLEDFQNYFIGQLTLASITGSTMAIAFVLLQVPYALLFGLGVGVLAVIPFGDLVGFTLLGLVLAAQNFWLGVRVLAVAIVIDQLIDQLVAPRLLGRFTGLRPLLVLGALLIGTKVGGLLGLVLAVPLTSFMKSLIDDFNLLQGTPLENNEAAVDRTDDRSEPAPAIDGQAQIQVQETAIAP
jgi:predicted PurR-regulated permease PerM